MMRSTNSVGRTLGILLLLHLVVGLTAPFIILHAVTGSRGFLLTAAENAVQVRTAVFLLTIGSAMAIAVSAAVLPTFRRYSSAMAFWLFALAIAGFSLQSVDNGRLLSMLSLSQQYASAGVAKAELFESLALVVGSARKWAHYTYLLVAVSWIFLLFLVLFRFRLVPRALAAFGLIGSLLQIAGVTVRGMLGYSPETRLAMPLAPAYAALAIWLIVKGLNEQQSPLDLESSGTGIAPVS
jgi:hypothetical protein